MEDVERATMYDATIRMTAASCAAVMTAAAITSGEKHQPTQTFEAFFGSVMATITGKPEVPGETFEPAVDPKKSVKPDYLISLIDGKRYKSLKRHLGGHGLTPEAYRLRYGLKHDYPMTAPNYSKQRSALAKAAGLGKR